MDADTDGRIAARPERRRILLVDDDQDLARIVELHLRRGGYDVELASRGGDALMKLASGRYDAVITDSMMPDLNGLDLLRAIREDASTSSLPVLMLTRNRAREDVERALRQGCSDYILKPLDPALLLAKLHRCLRGDAKPVELTTDPAAALSAFDGEEHSFFELPLAGSQSIARMQMACSVRSLGEAGLTLVLPFAPASAAVLRQLDIPLLQDIGLRAPVLTVQSSEPLLDRNGETSSAWLVHCSFAGMDEADHQKIRRWLQREQLRRRK